MTCRVSRMLLTLAAACVIATASSPRPCLELSPELRHFPCNCELLASPDDDESNRGVSMNCDGASFAAEMPPLPRGAPVFRYRHSDAGLRAPPPQMFVTGAPLAPIYSVDLSGNHLRRLSGGHLYALRDTLTELRLADNLLGDALNPILSTGEFRGLARLEHLDISGNGIRAVEAGILRGCERLRTLVLDGNRLVSVPAAELGGPLALRSLSIRHNAVSELPGGTFADGQMSRLELLDVSGNGVNSIGGGALVGLPRLAELRAAGNRIARLDSDALEGPESLRHVDLSDNFLTEFPGVAVARHAASLTHLDLSANRITSLDNGNLGRLSVLQRLNLSRNDVSNLAPGTFLGLRRLGLLDLGINSLRAIEDDAFEGLDALETLVLTDNNILLVPASALGRLPRLASLQLDFNRIAAVSGDIVGSVAERAERLSLAHNVIRELPDGTFRRCRRLRALDLGGNLLSGVLSADAFAGTEDTLEEIVLAYNRLTGLPSGSSLGALRRLDLSDNRLTVLSPAALARAPDLERLNLSGNARLGVGLPGDLLGPGSHRRLSVLDLSRTGLRTLPTAVLSSAPGLRELYLSGNGLTELGERSFVDLRNLTVVDLSGNRLAAVRPHAFVNVMSVRKLILSGNRLVSYGGETFNTGTGLEELDLSDNRLAYMSPTSFRIHPRLRRIDLSDNRLAYFPAAELVAGLQYLEHVDLAGNMLTSLDELDFARMPRLRRLLVGRNTLDTVGDLAFHNCSQLQFLDLSANQLSRLGERSFEGLVRLRRLDLGDNRLTELPDTVFDRARIQALDSVDLSRNAFAGTGAPLHALRRQHFALAEVDLSHNGLTTVPADDSVLVNVERLDLSFNPLSEEAVTAVLGEPKTVRVLNLAGTGLSLVAGRLETPFLRHLNLSLNNISLVDGAAFERTSLLETLDLSHNALGEVAHAGRPPPGLQTIHLSDNPIGRVTAGDLSAYGSLRHLHVARLPVCTRLERDAFVPLRRLVVLEAFGYPRLGYLDVRGVLGHLPALERLNVECMDPTYGGGGESTTADLHPVRLREIGIHGPRVRAVAPGALSGLRAPRLTVRFSDTSLASLPPTLFFSVPRSTIIELDVTGSELNDVPPQLLAAIEDRRGRIDVLGLGTIPLSCDCGARTLRQHLVATGSEWSASLTCATPEKLAGALLAETPDDQLLCAGQTPRTVPNMSRGPDRTTTTAPSTKGAHAAPSTPAAEPDIIWSVEPRPPARSRGPAVAASGPQPGPAANNDDTLIIGIVGGVVSFIAVLIIGICIARLKFGGDRGGPRATRPVGAGGPSSVCACSSVKGAPPMYAAYHPATLPRTPVYSQPYFVPYPQAPDDKMGHR